MRCDEARVHLKALIDGELTYVQAWRVRRHVARCAACQKEVADLRAITGALSEADRALPPADLRARILAALPSPIAVQEPSPSLPRADAPRRPYGRYALSAAAAGALCTFLAVWIVLTHPATTPVGSPRLEASTKGSGYPEQHRTRSAAVPKAGNPSQSLMRRLPQQPPTSGAPPQPAIAPQEARTPPSPRQPAMVASLPQTPSEAPGEEFGAEARWNTNLSTRAALRMMKAAPLAELARPSSPPEGTPTWDFNVTDVPEAEVTVQRVARALGARLEMASTSEHKAADFQPNETTREQEVHVVTLVVPPERVNALKEELAKRLEPANKTAKNAGRGGALEKERGSSMGGGFGGAAPEAPTVRIRVRLHAAHPAPPPPGAPGTTSPR